MNSNQSNCNSQRIFTKYDNKANATVRIGILSKVPIHNLPTRFPPKQNTCSKL